MARIDNHGEIHNLAGQQNVYGSVFSGPSTQYVNCTVFGSSQPAGFKNHQLHKISDDEITASLSFPEMFDRRSNVESPHLNSCSWILFLDEYRRWQEQSRGLLWIKGKPGAGKSTLMSFLYDVLQVQMAQRAQIQIDFFFTARGVPLQRSSQGMLRSLLSQLFQQDASFKTRMRALCKRKVEALGGTSAAGKLRWQQRELESLLLQSVIISAQQQEVTIFIDALDEAGEQTAREIAQFFHTLNDHAERMNSNVKVVISCRHYPILTLFPAISVVVEEHNHTDICNFVHNSLGLDTRTDDESFKQWQKLTTDVIEKANGIFMWAALAVSMIQKWKSDGALPNTIRIWLQEIPKELENTYKFIVETVIDQRYRWQSFLFFQWLCLGERPLSLGEMRYALAANDSCFSLDVRCLEARDFIDTDERMAQMTITLSGGLAELVLDYDQSNTENGSQASIHVDLDMRRVRAIHQSVNDFFIKEGYALLASYSPVGLGKVYNLGTSREDFVRMIHARLYWSCIRYLVTEATRGEYPQHTKDRDLQLSPFARYAWHNVVFHAHESGEHRSRQVPDNIRLSDKDTISKTSRLHWELSYGSFDYEESETPFGKWGEHGYMITLIYIIAANGLINLLDLLTNCTYIDIDISDIDNCTPLIYAVGRGHLTTAKVLVSAGARVIPGMRNKPTPLEVASKHRHLSIIRWLLEEEAKLDKRMRSTSNALRTALLIKDTTLIKIFWEAGADLTVLDMDGFSSALQSAVFDNDKDFVQLLLNAGVDCNIEHRDYGSALQAASYEGHVEVVQMLLSAGAVDSLQMTGKYGNAINAAAHSGAEQVVQILLDAVSDTEHAGWFCHTAIQSAVFSGHGRVVQRLIEATLRVSSRPHKTLGKALLIALAKDREQIAYDLLRSGADVNVEIDQSHGTALQIASARGYVDAVHLMLRKGAQVNVQTRLYGTALRVASIIGEVSIVSLLLEAGADVDAHASQVYGTALCMASLHGHEAVVKVLLDAGADVNACTSPCDNALQVASANGHHAVIQLLMDAGATRPHIQTDAQTATASKLPETSHNRIVKMLLTTDYIFNTPTAKIGSDLDDDSMDMST